MFVYIAVIHFTELYNILYTLPITNIYYQVFTKFFPESGHAEICAQRWPQKNCSQLL